MQLTDDKLTLLSKAAIAAAVVAGEVIREHRSKQLSIKNKEGGDSLASQVVTEVDFLSQKSILYHLEPLSMIYKLGLLAEESADNRSRLENDYFWSIDPLDGTLPFIESTPGYSVSIALLSRSGIPQIGVIYDPVTVTTYHAVKGQGAFRNDEALKVKADTKELGEPLTIVMDRSFLKAEKYREIMEKLETAALKAGYKGLETISHGGAAMNACWVLEKSPACYFKLPKEKPGGGSLWDFSASACIFNEAGASATDIHGNPLDLNRPDSTFMNHKGILYCSDNSIAKLVRETLGI